MAASLTVGVWAAATMVSSAGALSAQKSAKDGVYTAAQADRGETLFGGSCASCHNPKDFTGKEFLDKWQGKQLFDLYDTIKATMPMDNPGSLKPEQYADTVAYLLELNTFPAGADELKGDDEAALKAITIDVK
jgi:mono/diheme cytochrome c family protein